MDCIDLTSKQSKMLRYVAKHSKQRQPTKVIKLYCIASIWRLKHQNFWVTSLNYKSNQITMDCIDLTSKQSKMLRYVAKHSKQRKPTKVIKLYCIASIWRLNDQNFWVTSLNYKSNQITMDCIDLTSKQSKMLRYVAKHSKQRKPTKVIKLYCIASIWRLNDQNFWVTSLNYKSNQITMDCIDLTSKQSKMLRYGRKTFKTTQTNESDQIILHCIDLTSKRSKLSSYVPKLQK